MTTLADRVRSFAKGLQPLGRQQGGVRALALFGLAIAAREVGRDAGWRAVRNLAAHAVEHDRLANALLELASAVDMATPSLQRAFSEVLIPDVLHAGAGLPALVMIAAQASETLHAAARGEVGEFFDAALAEVNQGKPAGETATSQSLARLMVELLELQPNLSLYDPCCGFATTLAESVRREPALTVHGVELNGYAAALARLRLYLHGARFDIGVRDVLRDPEPLRRRFDRVICDPPVSGRIDRNTRDHLAARYGFSGSLASTEAAFLLHCAEAVALGGRAVVLTPIALLSRESDLELRRRLLVRGQLEGVITLPTGIVPWTELAFALVILAQGGADRPVRLLDAEDLTIRTARGADRLSPEQLAQLVLRYREPSLSDRVSQVGCATLIEDAANLRPRTWTRATPEDRPDLSRLHQDAVAAEHELQTLAARLDALHLAREP